tara:strand:+ start:79 stop:435 length:357 start_codon:yes stop_codon:yes gene_type:complete
MMMKSIGLFGCHAIAGLATTTVAHPRTKADVMSLRSAFMSLSSALWDGGYQDDPPSLPFATLGRVCVWHSGIPASDPTWIELARMGGSRPLLDAGCALAGDFTESALGTRKNEKKRKL